VFAGAALVLWPGAQEHEVPERTAGVAVAGLHTLGTQITRPDVDRVAVVVRQWFGRDGCGRGFRVIVMVTAGRVVMVAVVVMAVRLVPGGRPVRVSVRTEGVVRGCLAGMEMGNGCCLRQQETRQQEYGHGPSAHTVPATNGAFVNVPIPR